MPIKPINHYSLSDPLSVYDEEAMTALELAARTAAKVNEAVDEVNTAVEKIPADIAAEVQSHIDNGDFDNAIDEHIDNVAQRINVLENSLPVGSTTMDAALMDIKLDINGEVHASPAAAVRSNQKPNKKYLESGDLNDLETVSGFYVVAATVANTPENKVGLLDTQVYRTPTGSWWSVQKWVGQEVDGGVYTRVHAPNKDWTPWRASRVEFAKKNAAFVTDDMNTFIGNCYGVAVGGANNTPENDTALIECQEYKTPAPAGGTWYMQTWTGINSGAIFHRIKRNGVSTWDAWRAVDGSGSGVETSSHPLKGARVVFLGDSIFAQERGGTGIVKTFERITGAICYNFAFGGTRLLARRETESGFYAFDGTNLCESIKNNDYTMQDEALALGGELPTYYAETLAAMKAFDWHSADYVVYNWGINDRLAGTPIATVADYIWRIIPTIGGRCGCSIIVPLSMTHHWQPNITADPVKDYVTACMEAVENSAWHTKMIDMYNIGINSANADSYFASVNDRVHLSEKGRARYARYLAGQLA